MKKFLIGVFMGIFLASLFYFLPCRDPRLRVEIGRLLDRDAIFLKNGSVIQGWVTKEADGKVWVEVKNGYFTLMASDCERIDKNVLLRYMRELI